MKKAIMIMIAVALLCAMFTGCSTAAGETQAKDKAILVVSFGTSYNDSRNITIGAIESAIRENYPDYDVRRAFTAQIIIDKLSERDGIEIDNVPEALEKLAADGMKTVIVQPTHLMNGYEYDDIIADVENYKDRFESLTVGAPLLSGDEEKAAVIECVTERTAPYLQPGTAIVFMGHGTEHEANAVYADMQSRFADAGYTDYFVGTVEGTPTLDDVMAAVKAGGYTRVVLEPLMVVAGDHANNDMAGDEADSWKSAFEAEGIEVDSVLEGLGQYDEIQDIYVQHTGAAIEGLS